MSHLRSLRVLVIVVTGLLGPGLAVPEAQAAPLAAIRSAQDHAKKGEWARALDKLDHELAREEWDRPEVKELYQICLRHVYLARRHRDATFQQKVLSLSISDALKVYDEVLRKVHANYLEKDKADLTRLFQQGMEELRLALGDSAFVETHLREANRKAIHDFLNELAETWHDKVVHKRAEALTEVREVALAAQKALGLKPTVVILEFACGACNSLDRYSWYLTPGQLNDDIASLKGELISVGIGPVVNDKRVFIKELLMGSPAAKIGPPLKLQDRILSIDKKSVDGQPEEAVRDLLKGEIGTTVELEVLSENEREVRKVVLTRERLRVASLQARMVEMDVGYIQLLWFQDTTPEELDSAIADLKRVGMKVLILDLRGNPGGKFDAAIHVAERFLAEGIIVSARGQARTHNKKYEANNLGALTMPLVVLVDGDTASAAEVVAGALKENHRATLVGQTTFGKGVLQGVLELETVPSGIRLTLAKLFSPRGHAYHGRGVEPDVPVEITLPGMDEAFQEALSQSRQLTMGP